MYCIVQYKFGYPLQLHEFAGVGLTAGKKLRPCSRNMQAVLRDCMYAHTYLYVHIHRLIELCTDTE